MKKSRWLIIAIFIVLSGCTIIDDLFEPVPTNQDGIEAYGFEVTYRFGDNVDEGLLVLMNIVYTQVIYMTDIEQFDRTEYWQTPKETWESKKGDCEDKAILFMYLIKKCFPELNPVLYCYNADDVFRHALIYLPSKLQYMDPTISNIQRPMDITQPPTIYIYKYVYAVLDYESTMQIAYNTHGLSEEIEFILSDNKIIKMPITPFIIFSIMICIFGIASSIILPKADEENKAVKTPLCPFCKCETKLMYYQYDDGTGFNIYWYCDCKKVKELEQQIEVEKSE